MITLNEWKELAVIEFIALYGGLAILGILNFIKNKVRNSRKLQCNRYNRNNFRIDCDEFMKTVYKKQEFIGQNKNRRIELIRLVG